MDPHLTCAAWLIVVEAEGCHQTGCWVTSYNQQIPARSGLARADVASSKVIYTDSCPRILVTYFAVKRALEPRVFGSDHLCQQEPRLIIPLMCIKRLLSNLSFQAYTHFVSARANPSRPRISLPRLCDHYSTYTSHIVPSPTMSDSESDHFVASDSESEGFQDTPKSAKVKKSAPAAKKTTKPAATKAVKVSGSLLSLNIG